MTQLSVRTVETKSDRRCFVRLPWSLYRDDPAWIPPLRMQIRDRLSARKNPYFGHAEVACFLAQRGGKTVGRVSAQVCELAQQSHGGKGTGHFGFFECEDRPETARALLDAAEQWLKRRGMSKVLGPFDLSINDEVGLLVDGFEFAPFVMMPHHHAYYQSLLEQVGFETEENLFAYSLDISQPYTPRIDRIVQRAAKDSRFNIRVVARSELDVELHHVLEIFKDAWSENWGYVPPTAEEVDHLIGQMRLILSRGLVVLAEVDGELAGFMIVLPNLNEFTRDLNGRLFPGGWLRLLWRLRFAAFQSVRVPLMGIGKAYQRSRVGASIALLMIDRCRREFLPRGVTECEMSWVLESNAAMRGILDAAGCEPYKRYSVYSKPVS